MIQSRDDYASRKDAKSAKGWGLGSPRPSVLCPPKSRRPVRLRSGQALAREPSSFAWFAYFAVEETLWGPHGLKPILQDHFLPLGRGMPEAKCAKRTQFRPACGWVAEECAKRSQTWRDWGMWAKAVVIWGLARPGSEMCKTNPNSKCQVSSLKCQVSDQKEHVPGPLTSNSTLHTSNSPPDIPVGGVTCKTNPICGGKE
jgi:hypothetical protein